MEPASASPDLHPAARHHLKGCDALLDLARHCSERGIGGGGGDASQLGAEALRGYERCLAAARQVHTREARARRRAADAGERLRAAGLRGWA
jgi:hypothetical protein